MTLNIIEKLKRDGVRITQARQAIVDIIYSARSPLTPLQIKQMLLDKGLDVNKTTVYRELEFLIEKNLIKQIVFMDGETRFEILPEFCHHHVVCNICGKIEDVIVKEKSLIDLIEAQSHFKVKQHSIEFQGLCQNCQ